MSKLPRYKRVRRSEMQRETEGKLGLRIIYRTRGKGKVLAAFVPYCGTVNTFNEITISENTRNTQQALYTSRTIHRENVPFEADDLTETHLNKDKLYLCVDFCYGRDVFF